MEEGIFPCPGWGLPPPNILLPNIKEDFYINNRPLVFQNRRKRRSMLERRESHWELQEGWGRREESSLIIYEHFVFLSSPLGPGAIVCVAQTSVVGRLSMSRPRLWICKRKSTRRTDWFLRSRAPKLPIAAVLQQRIAQKCQRNSFILNKNFCFREESKVSGVHIPKRATKTRRKHILGCLFSQYSKWTIHCPDCLFSSDNSLLKVISELNTREEITQRMERLEMTSAQYTSWQLNIPHCIYMLGSRKMEPEIARITCMLRIHCAGLWAFFVRK